MKRNATSSPPRYPELADSEWLRDAYAQHSPEVIARTVACHRVTVCTDVGAKPGRGPTGAQTKELKRLRALVGEPGGGVAPTAAVASAEITRLRQLLNR